jgi:hypothetical protein
MKKPLMISQLINYHKFCLFNIRHNANLIFSFIKVSCGFTQKHLFNFLVHMILSAYSDNFLPSKFYDLHSLFYLYSNKPHIRLMMLIFNDVFPQSKCNAFILALYPMYILLQHVSASHDHPLAIIKTSQLDGENIYPLKINSNATGC